MTSPDDAGVRQSCWFSKTAWAIIVLLIVSALHWMEAYEQLAAYVPDTRSSIALTTGIGGSYYDTKVAAGEDVTMLPDWRLTTQCSANTQGCVLQNLNRHSYAEYPFRLAPQFESLYEWRSELPDGWVQSLHENVLSLVVNDTTVKQGTEFDDQAVQTCISEVQKLSINDQLDRLLATLDRQIDMVSFTISDFLYAKDMMQDVYEMAHNVVGFKDAFFMVAMDRQTMELACQYNYPFLAWPQQESGSNERREEADEKGALKKTVASSKFVISYELAKRRQSFFFFEMDVWFVRSPIPTLQERDEDIVFSGHQDNPEAPNIGVYSVRANEASEEFLRHCIEIMEQSPNIHDQAIMQQVNWFLDALKQNRTLEYARGKRWFPENEPLPTIPNFTHRATHGRFVPYQIAADVFPLAVEDTLAIHTLCGAPLRNPHGKKMVAKELGAWYGSGKYYYAEENRYLWLDGHTWNGLSMAMSWPGFHPWALYHAIDDVKWIIASTLALAKRTNRIWVMPKLLGDHYVHYIWTLLDMESVEALGVEVRETNFPTNPKSWHNASIPFGPVVRTALGSGGKMFVQPNADSGRKTGDIWAWNSSVYEKKTGNNGMFDAWFALHTVIPELAGSQVLLTGMPASRSELSSLSHKERTNATLTIAEAEIVQVWKQLRWCNYDSLPSASRSTADSDCYLKGSTVRQD